MRRLADLNLNKLKAALAKMRCASVLVTFAEKVMFLHLFRPICRQKNPESCQRILMKLFGGVGDV